MLEAEVNMASIPLRFGTRLGPLTLEVCAKGTLTQLHVERTCSPDEEPHLGMCFCWQGVQVRNGIPFGLYP